MAKYLFELSYTGRAEEVDEASKKPLTYTGPGREVWWVSFGG